MTGKYNLGIGLKVLNLLVFTTISILIIKLNSKIATLQLFAIIAIFSILLLLPWVVYTRGKFIKPNSLNKCLLRGAFNYFGMWSWIEALKLISPNEATALSYMAPIFTTILAIVICKEKVNTGCIFAILFSLGGVYLILNPNHEAVSVGGIIALCSALAWAGHDVVCKLQTVEEHPIGQALYNFILMALFSLPLLDWGQLPNITDWVTLLLLAALSVTNVIVLFLSYKYAPLTVLMPFSFLRLLFMIIAAYIFLGDMIKYQVVAGAIVIMASVGYIFIQQQKKSQEVA